MYPNEHLFALACMEKHPFCHPFGVTVLYINKQGLHPCLYSFQAFSL